jgi:hypothetical protein
MPDVSAIEQFRNSLNGQLVLPEDTDFDEVRAIWNGMIDRRPSLIARCADAADVVTAVNFARDQGLSISVRCGGHSVAGKSLCDDGLVPSWEFSTPRRRNTAWPRRPVWSRTRVWAD